MLNECSFINIVFSDCKIGKITSGRGESGENCLFKEGWSSKRIGAKSFTF